MQLSLAKHRSEVISLVRSAVYEKCFLCNRILYLMALASSLGVTLHTLNFHSLDHRHSLPHDCYPRHHRRIPWPEVPNIIILSMRRVWYHSHLAALVTWRNLFLRCGSGWLVASSLCMSKSDTAHAIPYNLLTNLHSVATYEIGIFFVGTLIFERCWTMPSGLGHRLNWRPIVRPVCSSHNHN